MPTPARGADLPAAVAAFIDAVATAVAEKLREENRELPDASNRSPGPPSSGSGGRPIRPVLIEPPRP